MNDMVKKPPHWREIIKKYNSPDTFRSIWQIINSVVPYFLIYYLMYRSMELSYWITLALAVPAAGFLVRMFIIFHDCGHGSFFRSERANRIVGTILGSLAFTPYDRWHNDHAVHHSTVGNLDKRGKGDVWTLTTEEYLGLSKGKKFIYRIYRNPVILFLIGPFFLFVIWSRFTRKKLSPIEKRSVYITNVFLLVYITGMILLIGWKAFVLIQLPVTYLSTSAGVWLFYLQHQFDEVIWTRKHEWDYERMALEGSSYLKFPAILHWFSGNIGYHHIHHLSPMIPNYNLKKCHRENSLFSKKKPVTFIESLRTIRLRLWDEKDGQLISFRKFRSLNIKAAN